MKVESAGRIQAGRIEGMRGLLFISVSVFNDLLPGISLAHHH